MRGATMQLLRHPRPGDKRLARTVLALGNFDGVHRGHRAILKRAVGVAHSFEASAGLVTFYPHPAAVLAPGKQPPLILPFRGKLERLATCEIDFVWVARFTRAFAQLEPEEFVRDFLLSRSRVAAMVVGDNVSFGRNRAGNAETLRALGKRYGFDVEAVDPVMMGGLRVSSTAVRQAVLKGDVVRAEQLLGCVHELWGRVCTGEKRGRLLGFPTANLRLVGGLLPADGVYAVHATVLGASHRGVANVGRKPTFGESPRGVEVYLLDFSGDLYGEPMRVGFVERLRGEARFESPDALVKQIQEDVARARRVLHARGRATRTASETEAGGEH